jgi:hypothetical protein
MGRKGGGKKGYGRVRSCLREVAGVLGWEFGKG